MENENQKSEGEQLLEDGTAAFYACDDSKAEACFTRAMELQPEGKAASYLANLFAMQYIPNCHDTANVALIDKAVEIFTEIAEHHPIPEIRETGKRQLKSAIYIRDYKPIQW